MKKLFFILITLFTISCTKEEPMVYEDIMGTYQYTHETYGKLEFEIAKKEQRFVLFSIPSENQTYRLINGYDFVVESSFVSLSFHHDQFYLFHFIQQGDTHQVSIRYKWGQNEFSYDGPVTKIK